MYLFQQLKYFHINIILGVHTILLICPINLTTLEATFGLNFFWQYKICLFFGLLLFSQTVLLLLLNYPQASKIQFQVIIKLTYVMNGFFLARVKLIFEQWRYFKGVLFVLWQDVSTFFRKCSTLFSSFITPLINSEVVISKFE